LALIDDFLSGPKAIDPTSHRWLNVYQRGWHPPNLLSIDEVQSLAAQQGLHLLQVSDLSHLLRLRAFPDLLAQVILEFFKPLWSVHPIIPSMLGSIALQQCLRGGAIAYSWLLFEKSIT